MCDSFRLSLAAMFCYQVFLYKYIPPSELISEFLDNQHDILGQLLGSLLY